MHYYKFKYLFCPRPMFVPGYWPDLPGNAGRRPLTNTGTVREPL